MNIIVKFYHLLQGVTNIFKSGYLIFRYSDFGLTKMNDSLRCHTECLVIGNGPSLKITLTKHIKFFKDKDILCVNDFVLSPFFEVLEPKYCIFADPAYWSKSASGDLKNLFSKTAYLMVKNVKWKMILFLPKNAKEWNYFIELSKVNPNITINYYNTTVINCFGKLKYYIYRHNLAIVPSQNVLIPGIFLSLNMGYKNIYIAGADHSWHENIFVAEDNKLYLTNTRIFDGKKSNIIPYTITADQKTTYKMHEIMSAYSKTFLGYHELNSYAKYLGNNIINVSEKSYIDAFERKQLK